MEPMNILKNKNFFIITVFIILLTILNFALANEQNSEKIKDYHISSSLKKDSMIVKYSFEYPKINDYQGKKNIEFQDLDFHFVPGEPILPIKNSKLVIPSGKKLLNFEIDYGEKVFLINGDLKIAQEPIPLVDEENYKELGFEEMPQFEYKEYILSGNYPEDKKMSSQGEMKGFQIFGIDIFPIEYDSETKDIFYYPEIILTLNFESNKNVQNLETLSLKQNSFNGPEKRFQKEDALDVALLVDNPEFVEFNRDESSAVLKTSSDYKIHSINDESVNSLESVDTHDYIVITNTALNNCEGDNFQSLVNSKGNRTSNNLTGNVVLVEDILLNPNYFCGGLYGDDCYINSSGYVFFNDTAAKIRNFIKYAYRELGTQYVLLGGDISIIPARSFYVNLYRADGITGHIPSDVYYSNLNGTFNDVPDNYWGWTNDNPDLYAEVYVGRAPVNGCERLNNFVSKTLLYESLRNNYSENSNYFLNSLFISNFSISKLSTIHSYFITNSFNVSRIPTNGSKTLIPNYLNNNALVPPSTINHAGHGNSFELEGYGTSNKDGLGAVSNMYPNFFYSQACYSGNFDYSFSFVNSLIFHQNNSYAAIMNSRYGWYTPNDEDLYSGAFMNEFWDSVLYEGYVNLGKAHHLSKQNKVYLYGPYTMWIYYSLNLFGDPEQSIVVPTFQETDVPIINVFSPETKEYAFSSFNINYSINESNFKSCVLQLYYYGNNSYLLNQTGSSCKKSDFISKTNMDNGNYSLFISVLDKADNFNSTQVNFTVNNIIESRLIILSPLSQNYNVPNILLNISNTNESGVKTIYYSLNGSPNITYSNPLSLNEGNLSDGNYTLNVWLEDKSERIDFANINFSIDTIIPEIHFTLPMSGFNYPAGIPIDATSTNKEIVEWGLVYNSQNKSLDSVHTIEHVDRIQYTNITLDAGCYNLSVYGIDASGNMGISGNASICSQYETYTVSNNVIYECGMITEPGNYELNADLQSAFNSCLNITASNVYVNGQGFGILGNLSKSDVKYGVYFNGNKTNITLINFSGIHDFEIGVYADNLNNTLINIGFVNSSNYDLYLLNSEGVILKDSSFNSLNHSLFVNNSLNLDLVNVSWGSNSSFNGIYNFTRKWYYSAIVKDNLGNVLGGANITGYDSNNTPLFSAITGSNGLIDAQEILSYTQNFSDNVSYLNYKFISVYNGLSFNRIYNFSSNVFDEFIFTLSVDPPVTTGGGGGGGGSSVIVTDLLNQTTNILSGGGSGTSTIKVNSSYTFNLNGTEYNLVLQNINSSTNETLFLIYNSNGSLISQELVLGLNESIEIDLDGDGIKDIALNVHALNEEKEPYSLNSGSSSRSSGESVDFSLILLNQNYGGNSSFLNTLQGLLGIDKPSTEESRKEAIILLGVVILISLMIMGFKYFRTKTKLKKKNIPETEDYRFSGESN